MSLRKIGKYNNFPAEYNPPKLAKDEVAVYRLIVSNPDPAIKGVQRFPNNFKIRSVDRVQLGGETYDIGLVTRVDKEGDVLEVRFINISNANREAGYFRLIGGRIADEELYTFLELTNANESNENRDKSIEPSFKRIDQRKNDVTTRKQRSRRLEAMTAAQNFDLKEVREFTAARGWNEDDDEVIMRNRIEEMAEKDPEGFIKAWGDKDQIVKATIKRAQDRNVIRFDTVESKWLWGGASNETIYVVARKEGMDPIVQLSDFFASASAKSKSVYKQMQKELETEEVTA